MKISTNLVRPLASVGSPAAMHPLHRLRHQLMLGLLVTVVLPIVLYHMPNLGAALRLQSSLNTGIGASAAFIIALYLYRRVASHPGFGLLGYVMPAVAVGYGIVLAIFFSVRLDYSRLNFGMSFVAALGFFFLISFHLRRHARQRFYIVPSDHAVGLTRLPGAEWTILKDPVLPADNWAVLIADLRADMEEDWERLIAEAALNGYPVYHSKQVQESLTGRVEIEHLSENSFGSLIPNHSYNKIKRLFDLLILLALLPVLLPLLLVSAILIKINSPGPVFFRQVRRGYRGQNFEMLKFRTMFHQHRRESERQSAITQTGDPRITSVGRFLRRTRIDELPQVWNILRGEMSWIGPRPEALPLSEWYMAELPFYTYRHIVRPGITGWAQVNQGHVSDLDGVLEKLHYDFFYIKHFSGWLDVLILLRTIGVVFSGNGAK